MRECLGVSYFRKTPHLISLIGSEYVFYLIRSFQIQSAAIVIVLHAVVYVSGEFLKEMLIFTYRSSRLEVLCRKGVFRNFAKFTGKQSSESLVPEPRPANLLKKRLWHTCFPLNLAKFLRIFFFTEHFRWLLLHLQIRQGQSQIGTCCDYAQNDKDQNIC